ncbi:MAG: DUF222 domain-containing protein [Actinomycetota bacterium]
MVAALADRIPPLEDRIASTMGGLNLLAAELVGLIGEALQTGAWQVDGVRSPEHWVAWQCGMAPARAAALVSTARGLADLPACRELFEQGRLSEDQARVVAAGGVDPVREEELAVLAPLSTIGQLRRLVQRYRKAPPEPPEPDENDTENDKPAGPRRELAFGYGDDGWFWSRTLLPPEEGALYEAALTAARDAEFRLRHPDADPDDPSDPKRCDVSWADGLLRLCDAALSNLDPTPGARPGERYQVYLHVNGDAPFSSYLHLGPSVSDSVRRYLTCDAPIRFVFERDGRIVALSAKQDTVDVKTRKLIEDRDGGCRVPGCGQRRWLHIHHLIHREDHGPTVPENLCCLCPTHHRLHHRGRLAIDGDPTRLDGLRFTTPAGRRIGPARPRPPGAPPRGAAPYQHPLGERIQWRWFDWN